MTNHRRDDSPAYLLSGSTSYSPASSSSISSPDEYTSNQDILAAEAFLRQSSPTSRPTRVTTTTSAHLLPSDLHITSPTTQETEPHRTLSIGSSFRSDLNRARASSCDSFHSHQTRTHHTTPRPPVTREDSSNLSILSDTNARDRASINISAIAEYLSNPSSLSQPSKEFSTSNPILSPPSSKHTHPEFSKPPIAYKHSQLQNRFTFYSPLTSHLTSPTFRSLHFPTSPALTTLLETPFWLDITAPTPSDLKTLSRLFKIHPLTAEDIQMQESREKCESFKNYSFVVIQSVEEDPATGDLLPINVYILIYKECVLTFHAKPMIHLPNMLHRIDRLHQYGMASVSPDWLNYALMDDIADGFQPLLDYTAHEVRSIDALVLILKAKEQTDMLLRIGKARNSVMNLLHLLTSKVDLIKSVIKRSSQPRAHLASPDSETALYLGDIQDHIITMIKNLNHHEKTLARAHSNYLAQISIEITQSSNRATDIATKVTALASILVPLNVVTGLFGMNVKVPGQDVEDSISWFLGICVFMCVLAYACFMFVRRYGV
ncbi:CorA metal ion transporter [Podochytrium sp. JEL0797]|nr:CorA metal ion transporter [Podochytrium sp. JEL0797]